MGIHCAICSFRLTASNSVFWFEPAAFYKRSTPLLLRLLALANADRINASRMRNTNPKGGGLLIFVVECWRGTQVFVADRFWLASRVYVFFRPTSFCSQQEINERSSYFNSIIIVIHTESVFEQVKSYTRPFKSNFWWQLLLYLTAEWKAFKSIH